MWSLTLRGPGVFVKLLHYFVDLLDDVLSLLGRLLQGLEGHPHKRGLHDLLGEVSDAQLSLSVRTLPPAFFSVAAPSLSLSRARRASQKGLVSSLMWHVDADASLAGVAESGRMGKWAWHGSSSIPKILGIVLYFGERELCSV